MGYFLQFYRKHKQKFVDMAKELFGDKDILYYLVVSNDFYIATLIYAIAKMFDVDDDEALIYSFVGELLDVSLKLKNDALEDLASKYILLKTINLARIPDRIIDALKYYLEGEELLIKGKPLESIDKKSEFYSYIVLLGQIPANNSLNEDILMNLGKEFGYIYITIQYLRDNKIDEQTAIALLKDHINKYEQTIKKLGLSSYRNTLSDLPKDFIKAFVSKYKKFKNLELLI